MSCAEETAARRRLRTGLGLAVFAAGGGLAVTAAVLAWMAVLRVLAELLLALLLVAAVAGQGVPAHG